MNESARHVDLPIGRFTTPGTGRATSKDPGRRGETGPDHHGAIGRHLESVRSHIEVALGSCARRESQGELVEMHDPWQFAPHHLTEIDSLRRLGHHLDRLRAQFRATRPHDEIHGASNPLHEIDRALAECAETMARRFEAPDVRLDLRADLESDLRAFESLLDRRALPGPSGGSSRHRGDLAPGRLEAGRGDAARRAGDPDLPESLREYRAVLQRVDRHIAEAGDDFPLRQFWRGARLKFQEEAERLTRSIGATTDTPTVVGS